MLRVGIPAHRLPREVLDREIEVVTNLGGEIRTDTPYDVALLRYLEKRRRLH